MNAVSLYLNLLSNQERVESIDVKKFMTTGDLIVKFKNLTKQEKGDLSHLRLNVINGAMFDDRGC